MALTSQGEIDPDHIVLIVDFSQDTLRNVIAHLEVSTGFDHLIYREAELDAIWTLTSLRAIRTSDPDAQAAAQLHAAVQTAHDLVAANRPQAAADILRNFL
jgi:hypothetical protein